METKKIAVACFIGGALCSVVALLLAPAYWWLGLVAGMAAGYISYEFSEVFRAIPIALAAAGSESVNAWTGISRDIRAYFAKPHPVLYPWLAIITMLFVWMIYSYGHTVAEYSAEGNEIGPGNYILSYMTLLVLAGYGSAFITGLFLLFAYIGAKVRERCYWWSPNRSEEKELQRKGFRQKPLSYQNSARWFAKGFGLTVLFLGWTLWKYLVIIAWAALCFFVRFAWHLFKLIHSKKRTLCAIDGTLGGVVAYIWLGSGSLTFAEQAMVAVFGGLLGAAFGVANWEVVSKRIFHVPVNDASA